MTEHALTDEVWAAFEARFGACEAMYEHSTEDHHVFSVKHERVVEVEEGHFEVTTRWKRAVVARED